MSEKKIPEKGTAGINSEGEVQFYIDAMQEKITIKFKNPELTAKFDGLKILTALLNREGTLEVHTSQGRLVIPASSILYAIAQRGKS